MAKKGKKKGKGQKRNKQTHLLQPPVKSAKRQAEEEERKKKLDKESFQGFAPDAPEKAKHKRRSYETVDAEGKVTTHYEDMEEEETKSKPFSEMTPKEKKELQVKLVAKRARLDQNYGKSMAHLAVADCEKRLRTSATKGVVTIFNKVKELQDEMMAEEKEAQRMMRDPEMAPITVRLGKLAKEGKKKKKEVKPDSMFAQLLKYGDRSAMVRGKIEQEKRDLEQKAREQACEE